MAACTVDIADIISDDVSISNIIRADIVGNGEDAASPFSLALNIHA